MIPTDPERRPRAAAWHLPALLLAALVTACGNEASLAEDPGAAGPAALDSISATPADGQVAATVAAADPHAHHRAMMNQGGYRRSEHCYELPDTPLVAADGAQTSLQAMLAGDRPVLLNFIFTTCTTICPVQSAAFRQVQEQLGDDSDAVRMVSISIDPEYDTPARLRDYAARFEAGPQWEFFTGRLEDVITVQKAFDAYRGNKMSHEPLTLLRMDPDGSWVRLDGMASAGDIVREYRGHAAE